MRKGALIMAASALLYGSVQIPAFLGFTNDPQVWGLCLYLYFKPRVLCCFLKCEKAASLCLQPLMLGG